jgi:hypothetical protein
MLSKTGRGRLPASPSVLRGYSASNHFCWAGPTTNRRRSPIEGDKPRFAKTHARRASFTTGYVPSGSTIRQTRLARPVAQILFRVSEVTRERINASRKADQQNNANGRKNKKSEQHT